MAATTQSSASVFGKPHGHGFSNPIVEDQTRLEHVQLITSFDGPSERKAFATKIKQALREDDSPLMTFYGLLNLDPSTPEGRSKFDEASFNELLKQHVEFCQPLYRFVAFSDDLIHPFHMLSALGASTKTLRKCLKGCDAAIFHDTSAGGAPIHYAIQHHVPFDVMRWLVKKDTDALSMTTPGQQQVPLHIACANGTDFDTIAFLTFKCGAAALRVDANGRTPLHIYCNDASKPNLKIIEDLTEVGPDACAVVADGETPLLIALRRGFPHDIVRDLLVSQPKAAQIANKVGMLPLHIAISSGVDIEIVRDLIKAYGDSVSMKEPRGGNLPVHLAVQQKCTDMDLYLQLARKYPEGLEEENDIGLTPHELAKKLRMKEDVVEFLNPFEEVEE